MWTQKNMLDPSALDGNRAPNARRGLRRRVGAFTVVVVIGLMAVACSPRTQHGRSATAPADRLPTVYPADPKAEEVATSFVEAFGLFDGERLGAGPRVFGDVEQHAFGAIQLDLEPADAVAGLIHVMPAAQRLDLL